MLISLILPVYNVEAYLGNCIESCLNQDLPKSEYEIIVVIDGSPDRSIDVVKCYQKGNDNIRIITRENGGLSAARNSGLMEANGDYVWFIDSDDYIKPNVLNDIVKRLESNQLDCLWLDWQDIDEKGCAIAPFAPHFYHDDKNVMSGNAFMAKVLSNYLYAWTFVYRRSFLLERGLLFTEGMFYEDTDFAFRSLPLIQRIQRYGCVCYNYLQRESSIVHNTNMRKLEDISKNCVSASKSLKTCDASLKRFYEICFTSYYMLFVKEVLKSRDKDYIWFLIEQTEKNSFGKVCLFGNLKTKIIGLLYNLFGIKLCCKFWRLFFDR